MSAIEQYRNYLQDHIDNPSQIPFPSLLEEFKNYNPHPRIPEYRGPGADWDAILEKERKMIHARIDGIFERTQISDLIKIYSQTGFLYCDDRGVQVPGNQKFIVFDTIV